MSYKPIPNDALRGASPVTCTDRIPIILQHQGHSRTIIGYEVSKTGLVNLLMFDPAKLVSAQSRFSPAVRGHLQTYTSFPLVIFHLNSHPHSFPLIFTFTCLLHTYLISYIYTLPYHYIPGDRQLRFTLHARHVTLPRLFRW